MNDILPAVFLVLIGVLVVAGVWLVGTNRRARAEQATAEQATPYRQLAEGMAEVQRATERRLSEIADRLSVLDDRVATTERILKDAE